MFSLDELMNENILLRGFGNRELHGEPPLFSLPCLAPPTQAYPNSRGQGSSSASELPPSSLDRATVLCDATRRQAASG